MPQARERTVPTNCSGYYHCVSRCVRRAWLCGYDKVHDKNYDYRRQWVEDRLMALAEAYSVSIYAYAVMSNHLHVVVKVDAVAAQEWSDEEVARRWCLMFPGSDDPEAQKARISNIAAAPERVATYRDRLRSLSWFMRSLAEPIARQANREDDCTGRFWEGRFKAQALVDERALLAAMVYTDLNPIRAKMTEKTVESKHTGVYQRIVKIRAKELLRFRPVRPIAGMPQEALSLSNKAYLQLVDDTGRQRHRGKSGRIAASTRSILAELKIDPQQWDNQVRGFGTRRVTAMGALDRLIQFARHAAALAGGIRTSAPGILASYGVLTFTGPLSITHAISNWSALSAAAFDQTSRWVIVKSHVAGSCEGHCTLTLIWHVFAPCSKRALPTRPQV
ncbi:transposase [Ahniella affigens]|uniref:Transposase n=1 Tax=Ahniella affigens TaxID=2021234 RepID=A0A2P1PWR2_9GAMM|nr:transposase [Ahniella affigens]AVP99298.1 transposase [Ahniella affigens]